MGIIEVFLDAADEVLNSNTFLGAFVLSSGDIQMDLEAFVASGDLRRALLEADIIRGWYQLHQFSESGYLVPRPGCAAVKDPQLRVLPGGVMAVDYLEALLRGDPRIGNFISFYRRGKDPEEARLLTAELLLELFAGRKPVLYILEPSHFAEMLVDLASYFEDKGCDNAALLASGSKGYVLLTNGIP